MNKIIIILGVVGCSFSAILGKYSTTAPTVLVFYRMIFSVVLLMPGIIRIRNEFADIDRRQLLLCIISGVFLGAHFVCYFASLQLTSVASSVVLVDTEVFFVALGGILFLRERVSRIGWMCILLTFLGSVVVAMGDLGHGHIKGDLIAFVGAACESIYTLIGRKVRNNISTMTYSWIVYLFAAIVVFAISTASGASVYPVERNNLLIALGLCIFCTLLGHSIFSWGLKYEKASFVSIAKLLEPIFAAVLAMFIFKEIPTLPTCLGGILIIFGIVLYTTQKEESF